jgi:pantothenate kinase-related protein Tda10
MILYHHHGLLNAAKELLEGYPPLIHMWYSRHFTANIWRKQQRKKVIARLKALCKVKEEEKFEARLKELEKYSMMMQMLDCLSNC